MKENLDTQLEDIRKRLDYIENVEIPALKKKDDEQQKEIDELRGLIMGHIGHP